MFWMDCEQFKQLMGKTTEISLKAKKIIDIHFGANTRLSSLIGEVETKRLLDHFSRARPTLDMFFDTQRECAKQLRANHFPAFIQSKTYRDMLAELKEIKSWGLNDTLRDPLRIRALYLLLSVERPEFVDTLRFALDLRNRYKPLIAEALLPITDANSKARTQKFHLVKEMIDLGKFFEKKYLSTDSKQYARGVTISAASRVRGSLDDCTKKLEQAMHPAQVVPTSTVHLTGPVNSGSLAAPHPNASGGTRWKVGGSTANNNTMNAINALNIDRSILDDTIRSLENAFKQAEMEANNWLERHAMADARRTDYFLTPIVETQQGPKDSYVEDVPSQDSILVIRLSANELAWRQQGPHLVSDRDNQHETCKLAHVAIIEPKLVTGKGREDINMVACDTSGVTVSGISRGIKFRTNIKHKYTFPGGSRPIRGNSVGGSEVEDQATKNSLAGISQVEATVEAIARSKYPSGFDSTTLANSELHSHCFPLSLSIEIDPISFANEPDTISLYHHFCLPCKLAKHSFEYNCTCLYGTCRTVVSKKSILIPTSYSSVPPPKVNTSVQANDSVLSNTSGAADSMVDKTITSSQMNSSGSQSFTLPGRNALRAKSPRSLNYSECAIWLQKVPNFGLGLNLALNRDGSVVVTRFVSDSQTPSPANQSGKINVEDELLNVNRVSVHGRRFDDIINQIKNSPSPVYLRFARGSYFEHVLASQKKMENRLVEGDDSEEFVKFDMISPRAICVLSYDPSFDEMKQVLDTCWKDADTEISEEMLEERANVMESAFTPLKSWRVDVSKALLNYLSVAHIVDILGALLLEKRILIVSDFPNRIAPAVLALLQMIRPLSWRHELSFLLPESHLDWFTQRVGQHRPFLAGLCTVDLVPQPNDQYIPKRQGRLTLREEMWSLRERDSSFPSDRFFKNGGLVRSAISLLSSQGTIIVDLDADRICGNDISLDKDRFPSGVREDLLMDINCALGRSGMNMYDDESVSDTGDEASSPGCCENPSKAVNDCVLRTLCKMNLQHSNDFVLSLKDGVIGFYRSAFLAAKTEEGHQDFLERFTKTEMFKEFLNSGWDIESGLESPLQSEQSF